MDAGLNLVRYLGTFCKVSVVAKLSKCDTGGRRKSRPTEIDREGGWRLEASFRPSSELLVLWEAGRVCTDRLHHGNSIRAWWSRRVPTIKFFSRTTCVRLASGRLAGDYAATVLRRRGLEYTQPVVEASSLRALGRTPHAHHHSPSSQYN